jgi:steroid delta-isomerase-like uncharacterized protein
MNDAARTIVEHYYEAFNAGDMVAFLDLLTADVTHDINAGARETGKPAFAAFMERMNAKYREQIIELLVLTEPTGTRAAAEFVVLGTYLSTDDGLPPAAGQTYRLAAGAFFDLRDGKIARVTNYYNLENWLAQVRGT